MRRPAIAAAVLVLLIPLAARAHFNLVGPESVTVQDATGNPQKTPPCGGAGTPSNAVTFAMTGTTLTVTVNETIFHPGHYRIAIAQDPGSLPPAPPVTQVGLDQCGSTTIDPAPVLPVLADGVFVHTTAFAGPQTTQIQLPPGYTCDNCVVQVLEFMSNHAAPCFYYHCATVTISDNPPPPPDAALSEDASPSLVDADTGPGGNNEVGGSCCDARPPTSGSALLAVLTLGLVLRPRRRAR